MTQGGKSSEVVGAFMNLLHEWSFRVNNSTRFENPMDFRDNSVRIDDVFQYSLNPDALETVLGKRQIMSVSYVVNAVRWIDVHASDTYRRVGPQPIPVSTLRTRSNNQQPNRTAGVLNLCNETVGI